MKANWKIHLFNDTSFFTTTYPYKNYPIFNWSQIINQTFVRDDRVAISPESAA